jgi:hypothetical protein
MSLFIVCNSYSRGTVTTVILRVELHPVISLELALKVFVLAGTR